MSGHFKADCISGRRQSSSTSTRSGLAGDALHLATASEHGASVHTLDPRLAQAGPLLGEPSDAHGF
jgi:predicted nucleic acid-binding protein